MKIKLFVFLTVLVAVFTFVPSVHAEEKMTNFKETVDEEIETFKDNSDAATYVDDLKKTDFSGYKEDDDNKVNVYIFRGNTCGYCLHAIHYFSSIIGEYGKYFNLKTYEVWQNSDNSALMQKAASVLGDDASGVPYIIIGKKSFSGYASSMNSQIEAQIKSEYEKSKSDRYDIMDHLDEAKDTSKSDDTSKTTTSSKSSSKLSVSAYVIVTIIILIADIIYTECRIKSVKKKYDEEIDTLNKNIKKSSGSNNAKSKKKEK